MLCKLYTNEYLNALTDGTIAHNQGWSAQLLTPQDLRESKPGFQTLKMRCVVVACLLRKDCRRQCVAVGATPPFLKIHEETPMNWEQIQGNWMNIKGKVKERWGDLTDDDLDRIEGRRDQLVGLVQKQYGIAKELAEKEVKAWEKTLH
jgi:uncharacterized protein YjbJ (UPF0337 family)